jgi:hypothetical protein
MKVLWKQTILPMLAAAIAASTTTAATTQTSFPTMKVVQRSLPPKDSFGIVVASASSSTTLKGVQVFECDADLKEVDARPRRPKIHGSVVRLCFRPTTVETPPIPPAEVCAGSLDEVEKSPQTTTTNTTTTATGSSWYWEMEYPSGWIWEMEYKKGWAERKTVMNGSRSSRSPTSSGGDNTPLLSLMECVVDQGNVCYLDTILSSGFDYQDDDNDVGSASVRGKGWASLTALLSPLVFQYKYYPGSKQLN